MKCLLDDEWLFGFMSSTNSKKKKSTDALSIYISIDFASAILMKYFGGRWIMLPNQTVSFSYN